MDIITLRTFLAAADIGSFSGAAQRVHASPSSVTERIKQLEHQLGARLFDRDKRGCRLTPAGRRFVEPAEKAVRALDIARHEVGLPERFTHSLAFGGQYVIWDEGLTEWLTDLRTEMPQLALRITAGASARLNRDLAEGFLDMTVLYDPVFRRDTGAEPLFEDKLVLVTGGDPDTWRAGYVRIEWGEMRSVEIAARLDLPSNAGLVLDLGARSAQWLIQHKMAGFMPLRAVSPLVRSGALRVVSDVPDFDFPAYVCWRRDLDPQMAAQIVASLKRNFAAAA